MADENGPIEISREALSARYVRVREQTETLVAPLSAEDAMVQSMPDASPAKWHLAHTTWFFEEFVLSRFEGGHAWPEIRWRALFNSYYDAVGARHSRAARGVLSRPSLAEIRAWRRAVDERMLRILARGAPEALELALLGTHHEQQHQELILTDIKHALWSSDLRPSYTSHPQAVAVASDAALHWILPERGIVEIGHNGSAFAFDNELSRHRVVVEPFALASRLVTNAEFAAFVDDGGYARPELWLSEGWAAVQANGWQGPLYWEGSTQSRSLFGMRGMQALEPWAPVAHVSFFEADAYARWRGVRLPTEFEWECAARGLPVSGGFVEGGAFAPGPVQDGSSPRDGVQQIFGDTWEWTASAYLPYPRFRPARGAVGEYNGKFMSGQMVLRGGSCFSPRDHLRATYRNFFPPATRWQVAGIRLACDAEGHDLRVTSTPPVVRK